MRVSQLFGETLREAPADVASGSHQLLLRAGYIRQLAPGLFSYLPLAWRSIRKVQQILADEMASIGGQEVNMPLVNPAEIRQQSGRLESKNEELVCFKDQRGREMVLASTHEETAALLAASEIHSYRQLPQLMFQFQLKYRDEASPRGGLLRTREFITLDAYSFDRDEAGLEKQYQAIYNAFSRIASRVGLPLLAVSGDPGSAGENRSHEFIYLMLNSNCYRDYQPDMVGNIALGYEGAPCVHCNNSLTLQKGVEAGSLQRLGTYFTEIFNGEYLDEQGKSRPMWMGSYGIGLGRLLACIVEEHHDDYGLCLPLSVAPYQVALVTLKGGAQVKETAEMLYPALVQAGIDVLYDDRDLSPGVKFNDADLRGIPLRLTVSERSLKNGGVEFKLRTAKDRIIIPANEAVSRIVEQRAHLNKNLQFWLG